MLLGLVRTRPRMDHRGGALVMAPANGRLALPRDWLPERGEGRFAAVCDVAGGFPGFAQLGGRLASARLGISDAYLLIDEGQPHGFGLPIQWLDGAAIIPGPGQRAALRIAYDDGATARHFTIAFRSGWTLLRPPRGAGPARATLLDLGLPDRDQDRAPALPDIHVAWDQTPDLASEKVVWTGAASAPVREGRQPAAGRVWLTTRSLIWGSAAGDGLNRVPLAALQDVITGQDEARHGTPAVYVGWGDPHAGRIDLPFLFDRQGPDRNLRERAAFLLGLRSRGVPLGLPGPLIQPWRVSVHRVGSLSTWTAPEPTSTSVSGNGAGIDAAADSAILFAEPAAETLPDDVVLAEFSAPNATQDMREGDRAALDDMALETAWAGDDANEVPGRTPAAAPGEPPFERVRAYEAAALAVLDEAMHAIRDRIAGGEARPLVTAMPTPALESAALAELNGLHDAGLLDPGEARARRARLAALAEAGWRLRSLIELRDAGHIGDADLARKRAEISSDLSKRLFPLGDR